MTEPPEEWFARADAVLPPSERAALRLAFAETRPVWLRVNTLRIAPEEAAGLLRGAGVAVTAGPWPEALRVPTDQRADALRHPLHRDGLVYMQSLSSQAAARALDPQPGEDVVDLCAAPGSKTGHIAALMGTGCLVANEVSRGRTYKMKDVLLRLGVLHTEGLDVRIRTGDGVRFRGHRDAFDRVLVDAPCSGDGRFHSSDPASWQGWSLKKVKACASKQKALLHAALDATKPGGIVVYATCTLAPEENEAVLARALKRYPEVTLEPLPVELPGALPALTGWGKKTFDPQIPAHARRLPPGPMWDGFFLARLRV